MIRRPPRSTLEWNRRQRQMCIRDSTIHKAFSFDDFKQAWSFMNKVADAAEKADHHPDWCNSYNQVSITLTTHQSGGLTAKDFDLASSIENILKTIKSQ